MREPGGSEAVVRSGVTAIWPHDGDLFRERVYAGTSVFNGYGEMTSNIVIDEWGLIGSPIVLIDTTHIPSANKPGGMTILNAATHTCGHLLAQQTGGQ